jgi:hypothetical protein
MGLLYLYINVRLRFIVIMTNMYLIKLYIIFFTRYKKSELCNFLTNYKLLSFRVCSQHLRKYRRWSKNYGLARTTSGVLWIENVTFQSPTPWISGIINEINLVGTALKIDEKLRCFVAYVRRTEFVKYIICLYVYKFNTWTVFHI